MELIDIFREGACAQGTRDDPPIFDLWALRILEHNGADGRLLKRLGNGFDGIRQLLMIEGSAEPKSIVELDLLISSRLAEAEAGDASFPARKSVDSQMAWISFLADLAKQNLDKEMKKELPFGTTAGVYMTIAYFKAIALNEGSKTINAMSDHMEKFNRIGYQMALDATKS